MANSQLIHGELQKRKNLRFETIKFAKLYGKSVAKTQQLHCNSTATSLWVAKIKKYAIRIEVVIKFALL